MEESIPPPPFLKEYLKQIETSVNQLWKRFSEVRAKSFDIPDHIETSLANDFASRVESLCGPPGVASAIRKHFSKGSGRILTAFSIAMDVVNGKFGRYSVQETVEQALRTSFGILSGAVTSVPLEGLKRIKLDNRTNHLILFFSSPIRIAQGLEVGLLFLVAERVREALHLRKFKPDKVTIERFVEELEEYQALGRLKNAVSREEITLTVRQLGVELNGEPTEKKEVQRQRDLPNLPNQLRGGMCQVLGDFFIAHASELHGKIIELGLPLWDWLNELVSLQESTKNNFETSNKTSPNDVAFLKKGFIGGRPIFSHPEMPGAWRIRYGRSRNTGLSCLGVHPTTMRILKYLSPGTQIAIEKPGLYYTVTSVSSIQGPLVQLQDGSVLRMGSIKEKSVFKDKIAQILDLGDILIDFGEFLKENQFLPSSWVEEYWEAQLSYEIHRKYNELGKAAMALSLTKNRLCGLLENPLEVKPSPHEAIRISKVFAIPLHPSFTPTWENIGINDLTVLRDWLTRYFDEESEEIVGDFDSKVKSILNELSIPHRIENEMIAIQEFTPILAYSLRLGDSKWSDDLSSSNKEDTILEIINNLSSLPFRNLSSVRIGSRMGKPEKSAPKRMDRPVHALFPVGKGNIPQYNLVNVPRLHKNEFLIRVTGHRCVQCQTVTPYRKCHKCRGDTTPIYICRNGHHSDTPKCNCGEIGILNSEWEVPLLELYSNASKKVGESPQIVKAVPQLMNKSQSPECLEKGIIRAMYDILVYKDGTSRFVLTNSPLTQFRPDELEIASISKLQELGYHYDVNGDPLVDSHQLLDLQPMDIVLNRQALEFLLRLTKMVDKELLILFDEEPWYRLEKIEELIGHFIVGLAPHTSVGVVGRIIGLTKARVCLAHPFWHSAKERRCDGAEDSILLLGDLLLNFSKSLLPDRTGGLMDIPLVVSLDIIPSEPFSEVNSMSNTTKLPLEFFSWASKEKSEDDLGLIRTIGDCLGNRDIFSPVQYTHDTDLLVSAPFKSYYKKLGSMAERVEAQLELASLVRGVDENDVVRRILRSHFFRDYTSYMRSYGVQSFRCTQCNRSLRRMPLSGSCWHCKGKVVLTVPPGMVIKYFSLAEKLMKKYDLSRYQQNRIEFLELQKKLLFEKGRQITLKKFIES